MKFYIGKENGEIVATDDDVTLCDKFSLLVANTTDAAKEKHVPVVSIKGDTVTIDVGSVPHPMTEAHLISLIALETTKGYHLTHLSASDKPQATFTLSNGEKPVNAYAYCNLHGMWVTKA